MSLIPIVCANCGAKYRLPETFKSDSAKCKKCGAVIDVAGQRDVAPEPAAVAAPAAETASPRSRRSGRAAASTTSRRSGSSSRRRSARGDDADSGRRRSRRGESEETVKGKGMLIGMGLGTVGVVVAVVLMIGGDPAAEDTAGLDPLAQPVTEPVAEAQMDPAPERAPTAEELADAAAAAEEAAAAEAIAEQAAAEEAASAEAAAKIRRETPWLSYTITTVEELFDPMTETEPVEWPDYVTDEERAEVLSLLEDVEGQGLPGIRAKTRLTEMDHKSLAGIINRLRDIDYTDSFDTMFAYELNKLIETMTITLNANFQNAEIGSAIDLRVAHWNAQTIKPWIGHFNRYRDKEDWDRLIASIKNRRQDG